ncbi:hypothetical protein EON65_45605 [archaeon]|nr:MAG: hypothetical protein EON65_45605 [archaeon]
MGVAPTKEYGPDSAAIITKPLSHSLSGSREVATFAGGCFWSIELAFQRVPGVVKTEVGYTQVVPIVILRHTQTEYMCAMCVQNAHHVV